MALKLFTGHIVGICVNFFLLLLLLFCFYIILLLWLGLAECLNSIAKRVLGVRTDRFH